MSHNFFSDLETTENDGFMNIGRNAGTLAANASHFATSGHFLASLGRI
jgi:hypothetical protein